MAQSSEIIPSSSLAAPVEARPTAVRSQQSADRLILVVTLLLIFIMAARTPLDTDMWWHLRAGEEIVRTGHFLYTDIFSFTRAGAHWMNPYWLAQISMALAYNALGYLGLSTWVALFASLSMVLVLLQCEGPAFLKALALLLGSVLASVIWSPRPQLISLVLLALIGYLLYLYKWRGVERLWALPLVFVLWANVHGGYPLGLIFLAGMLAGEVLNHVLGLGSGPVLAWRQIFKLGLWSIACGLAVLINPNGLEMWRLPFLTVNMHVLQQFIPEWASPDFHVLLEQSVLWLLLAVFAAGALAGRRMDGTDLVVMLSFGYMALLARRNFGPFALVATPILTRYAAAAIEAATPQFLAWRERFPWLVWLQYGGTNEAAGTPALKKVLNLAIVALLGLVALGKLYGVSHPALVNSYLSASFPVQSAEWLVQHEP